MRLVCTERVITRLTRLTQEVASASYFDCYDRLREFKRYCESTPIISHCLSSLPPAFIDLGSVNWSGAEQSNIWAEGESGYAQRWNAIELLTADPRGVERTLSRLAVAQGKTRFLDLIGYIAQLFVIPLYNYIVHRLQGTSMMAYTLLRYRRWAEWFEAERLRGLYAADTTYSEKVLDSDLRQFLFENGIDYPYSQPDSPGGRADIVAQLDTDDPLVLEVKVWDSDRGYKENRVRDGLRQAIQYADSYGKDRGYVVVFNLDRHPLEFVSPVSTDEWPPRIEVGGKTYYFIDVNIGEQTQPVSQRDKGKPIETQRIVLADLLKEPSGA